MTSDDYRGTAPTATASRRPGKARLVLELVISDPDPLSGVVGPVATSRRLPFHGWIDLMSAVHTLCADDANPPAAPR